MSKITDAIAKKTPAPSSPASKLLRALTGRRLREPITVPGLGIPALLTLVSTDRMLDIEGEVLQAMARRRLEAGVLWQAQWELERAKRVIAEAVLDPAPDDPARAGDPPPLGTVDDWGRVEPAVLVELHRMYWDFSERNDPAIEELGEDEIAIIRDAVEKKSPTALRRFGVRKLAAFMIITAAQPASSSTEKSSPGDSSPES